MKGICARCTLYTFSEVLPIVSHKYTLFIVSHHDILEYTTKRAV